MPTGPERAPTRVLALDGIRGLAIALVVVSHGWLIWSFDSIDENAWVRPLFRSGNFAVTIFLVVGGFVAYRSLAAHGLANMRLPVTVARRVIRVAPTTFVAVPIIIAAAAFTDETFTSETNWRAVASVFTYTWNWEFYNNIVTARWDLGHLWYLSVDMQAFVVMGVVLYLVRRSTMGVIATLAGLLMLLTWWRMHVSEYESLFQVLLRTSTRMDAFVAGMLVAALIAGAGTWRPTRLQVQALGLVSSLALLPLLWWCSRDERFIGWGVTLLEIDLALFLAALTWGARPLAIFTAAPFAFLGRHSLPLYVWHYPLFAAVEARTPDWSWFSRGIVAFVVTTLACILTYWFIERNVKRVLQSPWWNRFTPHSKQMVTRPPTSRRTSTSAS